MQTVYAILHRGSARNVLQVVADQGAQSLTLADLAARLGLSTSAVSECIKLLSTAGLVTRSYTTAGRLRLDVRDRDQVLELLAVFRRNVLDIAADNFVNLWDFESFGQ
jgi:DNA-binding IclR family transcriptional regulator